MPLHLFAVLVVVGIAMIIFLVSVVGQSMPNVIASPEMAIDRFRADFPDVVITRCVVTNDGQGALLALEDGRIGLIRVMGANYFTRIISAADAVKTKMSPRQNSLSLKLAGVGVPRFKFRFDDGSEIPRLAALFDTLFKADENEAAR